MWEWYLAYTVVTCLNVGIFSKIFRETDDLGLGLMGAAWPAVYLYLVGRFIGKLIMRNK